MLKFKHSFLLFVFLPCLLHAQEEKLWLKKQLNTLASPSMKGRGYVEKGGEKAAHYLNNVFKDLGLQSFYEARQHFSKQSFAAIAKKKTCTW
jgi:hypothetical protein